jgi:hypothetical protein
MLDKLSFGSVQDGWLNLLLVPESLGEDSAEILVLSERPRK